MKFLTILVLFLCLATANSYAAPIIYCGTPGEYGRNLIFELRDSGSLRVKEQIPGRTVGEQYFSHSDFNITDKVIRGHGVEGEDHALLWLAIHEVTDTNNMIWKGTVALTSKNFSFGPVNYVGTDVRCITYPQKP